MLQLVLHVEGHGEARAALQLTNMGKVTKHETFFLGLSRCRISNHLQESKES